MSGAILVGRFLGSNHIPSRCDGRWMSLWHNAQHNFEISADMMRFMKSVV